MISRSRSRAIQNFEHKIAKKCLARPRGKLYKMKTHVLPKPLAFKSLSH